jgi:hypothetical protein
MVSANGGYKMLKTLLAVSTILIAASSFAQASVPLLDNAGAFSASSLDQTPTPMKILADRGSDSGGGGNSGRGGHDDDRDSDDNDGGRDDHDRNDRHDGNDDNDNGNNNNNNSGCDSAHDIAEHANCRG